MSPRATTRIVVVVVLIVVGGTVVSMIVVVSMDDGTRVTGVVVVVVVVLVDVDVGIRLGTKKLVGQTSPRLKTKKTHLRGCVSMHVPYIPGRP